MSEKARRQLTTIEELKAAERTVLEEMWRTIANDMQVTLGQQEERFVIHVDKLAATLTTQQQSVIDAVHLFQRDYAEWRTEQAHWREGLERTVRDSGVQVSTLRAELLEAYKLLREARDRLEATERANLALEDRLTAREVQGNDNV